VTDGNDREPETVTVSVEKAKEEEKNGMSDVSYEKQADKMLKAKTGESHESQNGTKAETTSNTQPGDLHDDLKKDNKSSNNANKDGDINQKTSKKSSACSLL